MGRRQASDRQVRPGEELAVWWSRENPERLWCPERGELDLPEGWEMLPSGDAFLTRQVKSLGPHWIHLLRRKRYTTTVGVWAPSQNIREARRWMEETRASREAKRTSSWAHRGRAEARYRSELEKAVVEFLGFAPEHADLASTIARETVARGASVGSGRAGRSRKLEMEEKAELLARAHIRHRFTGYEDELARYGFPLDLDPEIHHQLKREAERDVDRFIARYRYLAG